MASEQKGVLGKTPFGSAFRSVILGAGKSLIPAVSKAAQNVVQSREQSRKGEREQLEQGGGRVSQIGGGRGANRQLSKQGEFGGSVGRGREFRTLVGRGVRRFGNRSLSRFRQPQ